MAKIKILEKEFHTPDPNAKNDGKQLHVPLGSDGKGMKFLNRETGDLELHDTWVQIFKTPHKNIWNKCIECGRFISTNDFSTGEARRTLITPDSEVSNEQWENLCKDCKK